MDSAVQLVPGLLSAQEARERGIARSRLAGPTYRRAARGVYVPATTPSDPADVRVAAAGERLPGGVLVGGWAAARLHEQQARARDDQTTLFDGTMPTLGGAGREVLPVLVCAPREARIRRTVGTCVFRSVVPGDEATSIRGVPVTSPLRTAFDLARLWPTTPALMALDRLANLGLIGMEDLTAVLRSRPRWRGVSSARRAVSLCDPRAESPRETALRLLWIQTGLPRPSANQVVTDQRGRFVARVDLIDPGAGVVGEYDGAFHAPADRRSRDAARQEDIEQLGLTVIRAAGPDLASNGSRRAWGERLRRAYDLAAVRHGRRAWRVIDPMD